MRSPTAAEIAARWVETDYAGLSNDADVPLDADQIDWADVILVMERRQAKRLKTLFGDRIGARKVVVLGVPDRFGYRDPALVDRLEPVLRARFADR